MAQPGYLRSSVSIPRKILPTLDAVAKYIRESEAGADVTWYGLRAGGSSLLGTGEASHADGSGTANYHWSLSITVDKGSNMKDIKQNWSRHQLTRSEVAYLNRKLGVR